MAVTQIREYDSDLRTVTTRDMTGAVISQRPYNAEENAEADAQASKVTNEQTLLADAKTSMTELQTMLATLQAIVDKNVIEIGPGDIKTIAREVRRLARQVGRLTRLSVQAFDSSTV